MRWVVPAEGSLESVWSLVDGYNSQSCGNFRSPLMSKAVVGRLTFSAPCRHEVKPMRWSSVVGVIGLSSSSALLTGCLTMGVMDRSTGRTKAHARITQVEQAAALGADLYLRLGVQSKKYPEIRTVVLKVPLAD